jgi:catechol 2,3-dioxygenase-like lactoylglutathione lyase family enzyme
VVASGHLHHLELYVADLGTAADFWGWLLGELGWECYQEWDEGCAYRLDDVSLVLVQAPEGARSLDRRGVGLNHVAFRAGSEAEVDALTERLKARGVRILYPDRHPFAGGTDHYAVFFEDPQGLKVEVVAPAHP